MTNRSVIGNERGATLVEIVVATFITALLTAGVSVMIIGGVNGWARGANQAWTNNESSGAAQKLAMEIRDGMSAARTAGPPITLTVTFPQESTDSNGEAVYNRGVAGQVRSYYYSDGCLKRNIGGVETIVMRGILQNGTTFEVSGGNVTIAIKALEQVGTYGNASEDSRTATARVKLRNYGNT